MKKSLITMLFILSFLGVNAQVRFNVSLNGGYSVLNHNTDFRTTPLYNLYDFVAYSHGGQNNYTWEDFKETYQVKEKFGQPRFGFTGQLTYKDYPFAVEGQLMSSSSTYTKASYSVAVGFGRDFYFSDSSFYFNFLGGYKYVIKDAGFGAQTLTNSIGLKEAREQMSLFFAPVEPLGRSSGDLLLLRAGIAKNIDWYYRWSVGVEGFYELDLTDKIVRSSRMTNYGACVFLRFKML